MFAARTLAVLLLLCREIVCSQQPADLAFIARGGGDVGVNGDASKATLEQLAALQGAGMNSCRTPADPGSYLVDGDWSQPNVTILDAFMLAAASADVQPVLLLRYSTGAFGSRAQWRALGASFATYLQPSGTWSQKYSIPNPNFGVTVYQALDEADTNGNLTRPGATPGPDAYVDAIAGFAEGVKSVACIANCPLYVAPGGFATPSALSDWTLAGLGPRLAPLWSNASLDAMDLHTYFDVESAPIMGTFNHSAQAAFDAVKAACGVTNDALLFYSSRFNYRARLVSEEQAAVGLFTAIWDAFGVVNAANRSVSRLVFPWSMFHTNASDPEYGMSTSLAPYEPTPRGATWVLTQSLLKGVIASADPRGSGVLVIDGGSAVYTVWQNRPAWSTLAGDTFNLTGLPSGSGQMITYYGWDGCRRVTYTSDATWHVMENITQGETALFAAILY